MKKLFLLPLALVMVLGLTACGGETPATLVDVTTAQGITFKLPSDMTLQDNGGYANTDASDIAVVMVLDEAPAPYSEWAQADFTASELSGRKDVVVTTFENNIKINGLDALRCTFSYTTESGKSVVSSLVMITDGVKEYLINFTYLSDNTDGVLATNLQACIDSITITAA